MLMPMLTFVIVRLYTNKRGTFDMKIIVLTGIIGQEKAQFAVQLAQAYQDTGLRVAIINNGTVPIANGLTAKIYAGLILGGNEPLYNEIQTMQEDVLLVIAAESAHPEALIAALDNLQAAQPDNRSQLIALIDDRTCDCFPHLREILEVTADLTLHAPFSIDEALKI